MTAAAVATFNKTRVKNLYARRGTPVLFRGVTITGITGSPLVHAALTDGGVQVDITLSCSLRQSDFEANGWQPPEKWERLQIRGKTYAIAGSRTDEADGEYRLQLSNPRIGEKHF